MDGDDIFQHIFNGPMGSIFGNAFGQPRGRPKNSETVLAQAVTLEDLYQGKTFQQEVERRVICSKCDGAGGRPGAVQSCAACKGRGIRVMLRPLGPNMMQQIQARCSECDGTGEKINEKNACQNCKGRSFIVNSGGYISER